MSKTTRYEIALPPKRHCGDDAVKKTPVACCHSIVISASPPPCFTARSHSCSASPSSRLTAAMCSSPSPSKTESATCSSAWPSPLPCTSPLSEWTCISQLGRTASSLSARSFDCGVFASSSAWRIDAPVESRTVPTASPSSSLTIARIISLSSSCFRSVSSSRSSFDCEKRVCGVSPFLRDDDMRSSSPSLPAFVSPSVRRRRSTL